jgi:RNA polymerase-interacting CarD/CdnL/TRCF family regulator
MDKRIMTPEQLAAIQSRFPHKDIPLYPMNVKLDAEGREQANYIDMRMIEQEETLEYAYEIVSHRADIPALLDHIDALQAKVDALAELVRDLARQQREEFYRLDYYEITAQELDRIINGASNESEEYNA